MVGRLLFPDFCGKCDKFLIIVVLIKTKISGIWSRYFYSSTKTGRLFSMFYITGLLVVLQIWVFRCSYRKPNCLLMVGKLRGDKIMCRNDHIILP